MASLIGALAQLVERFAGSEEVSGSNPLGSTTPHHAALRRSFVTFSLEGDAVGFENR
jgi:hypothetical protein